MGQIDVEKNVGGIEGLCVITPTVHGDSRGSGRAWNKCKLCTGQSVDVCERGTSGVAFSDRSSTVQACAHHSRSGV